MRCPVDDIHRGIIICHDPQIHSINDPGHDGNVVELHRLGKYAEISAAGCPWRSGSVVYAAISSGHVGIVEWFGVSRFA